MDDTDELPTAERTRKSAKKAVNLGLLHRPLSNSVIGGFLAVYWELGPGFLESVYSRALAVEFERRGVAFERQVEIRVQYRGVEVGVFRADFVVEKNILIEVKAVDRLLDAHAGQVMNYLHGTGLEVGLLLNFGPRPIFRRFVLSRNKKIAYQKP